jgi:hypothetical protein
MTRVMSFWCSTSEEIMTYEYTHDGRMLVKRAGNKVFRLPLMVLVGLTPEHLVFASILLDYFVGEENAERRAILLAPLVAAMHPCKRDNDWALLEKDLDLTVAEILVRLKLRSERNSHSPVISIESYSGLNLIYRRLAE